MKPVNVHRSLQNLACKSFNVCRVLAYATFCFVVFAYTDLYARKWEDSTRFPVPKGENLLFFLQRTKDANTVIYELNFKSKGVLDTENPVKTSWIRYTENGRRKELNAIEEKFAYGVVSRYSGDDQYEIRLAAYKKMPLLLKRSATDNKYHIFLACGDKESLLTRVFVQVNGGSFWNPKVEYIDITTTDISTGREFVRRINP
ncbi:DUF4833 domain-containing protein [Danxiaibacter flavus]|uniref:DUF4833 domain-containing protein n=1 Tax=Danxiaibacter flavus TaxID=3049108 RepID=A0ABV3ZCH8_9BACT|nr:DUF4833 domain-containing protein [Chitinophagaceae bacterium DXS]